jgi:hypothetical protein
MVAYFKHRKPKKTKINEKITRKKATQKKTTKTLSVSKAFTFAL